MSIELSGFDELINDLNNLGDVGKKVGRKAVQEASKIVLQQEKKDAPRDAHNSNHGANKLKVTQIKQYKSGTVVGKIGIDSSNWEAVSHLYYQHYGFEHYKSKKMVTVHVGWMNDSFNKCKEKAAKVMMDVASQEIDKILK